MQTTQLAQAAGELSLAEENSGNADQRSPGELPLLPSTTITQDLAYLDPTPKTPPLPDPPPHDHPDEEAEKRVPLDDESKSSEGALQRPKELEKQSLLVQTSNDSVERDAVSSPEIQNIMGQFQENRGDFDDEKTASISTEQPETGVENHMQHPPRSSSLEPVSVLAAGPRTSLLEDAQDPQSSSRLPSTPAVRARQSTNFISDSGQSPASIVSPTGRALDHNSPLFGRPPSLHKALPPEPDPEPDLPFDFHRFLEQLRHRSADPVAKFLRSFLVEFGKKQWTVHEQVKIISDFLVFITNKMAQCEVWQGVSDAEFDNAREGMEKLVMNRLYSQTFSPAIPPPAPFEKGRKRQTEKVVPPGRRGQHQEDVERDAVLEQKIQIYQWVRNEHLDLKPTNESGRKFLTLAQQGDS